MEGLSKYVYVVKWWPPFPASEYGGLLVLVAANDAECKSMLETRFPREVKEYRTTFEVALFDCKKMELAQPTLGTTTEAEIVEEFIT